MGKRERKIKVIGVLRQKPDIKRLGKALIELAEAQAEAEAQSTHQTRQKQTKPKGAA